MAVVTPELSLESAVARNPHLGAAPDPSIALGTPHAIPRKAHQAADFRRPSWLSPELVAFVVGALDCCLILAAAEVAFAVYFGLMDQRVAQPERHILTAFLAATVFAGIFERLGGYRSRQFSRLGWQVTRVLMTWTFVVAVLLLAAFLSKTSEIYSRGTVSSRGDWLYRRQICFRAGSFCRPATRVQAVSLACPAAGLRAVRPPLPGVGSPGSLFLGNIQRDAIGNIIHAELTT